MELNLQEKRYMPLALNDNERGREKGEKGPFILFCCHSIAFYQDLSTIL
jgi:hypothetical protein